MLIINESVFSLKNEKQHNTGLSTFKLPASTENL